MARFQVVVEVGKFPVGKVSGASVQVNLPGTSGKVPTLYADRSSSATLANPFTASTSRVDFYLAEPQQVDIIITPVGGVAVTLPNVPVSDTLPVHQSVLGPGNKVYAWYTS